METPRILRLHEVMRLTGLSKSSIYRKGPAEFPSRVRLGPRSVGWKESAIRDWLEQLEPVSATEEYEP